MVELQSSVDYCSRTSQSFC